MTIALMIFATAAAYAAGIATMLVVTSRRATLARPIPPAWVPRTVKIEPPPKRPGLATRSLFAPKRKPEAIRPRRVGQLHWPVADPEPELSPALQAAPAATAGPARACLPENEWRPAYSGANRRPEHVPTEQDE